MLSDGLFVFGTVCVGGFHKIGYAVIMIEFVYCFSVRASLSHHHILKIRIHTAPVSLREIRIDELSLRSLIKASTTISLSIHFNEGIFVFFVTVAEMTVQT